ncbi:MAG: radical SAM protein [bacterium]|nr:radical SAM protein [bacterium]
MKILLISVNRLQAPYPVYPLSLDYVAGAISSRHETRIADMNQLQFHESLEDLVKEFKPDIIGLSLRNIDNTDLKDPRGFINRYKETADVIRKVSKVPLVLGGAGFTIFPGEVMKALEADYGIIGEGERINLLLDALENRKSQAEISKIPGILVSSDSKEILDAEQDFPSPWEDSFQRNFDINNPHIAFYLKKGGMLNLQTKRGCTFKCVYCTYPHIEGNTLRLIEPREVAETALKLEEAGAKYFFITDSAFNCDYEHSMEVAQAFIRAKVSIPWGAFFAPTTPPPDYYTIMAEAGLSHVEFGTESLSNTMLAAYKKPFNSDDVLAAHEKAKEAGLHIAHYLLLGGPGEEKKTLDETLIKAENLEKTVLFFFCGIRIYPHTALYDIALKEGKIDKNKSLLEPVFYQTDTISSEEILALVEEKAGERDNWIVGSGGPKMAKIISRMYARGHSGPLWEYLIS